MLELDDIQHILLTRTPAITGRYEFLTFDTPAGGRAWLSELIDLVQSAADARATMDESDRWVTLAFTWNGLRALGVPEESLATFPDEFREGMPPAPTSSATPAPTPRSTGSAGWPATTCTPSRSCSPATTSSAAVHRGARRAARPDRRRAQPVVSSTSTRHRRSTTPTTTSASATGCRSR